MLRLFAVTAPGLEPLTRLELAGLGIQAPAPAQPPGPGEPPEEAGGLEFDAEPSDLYRANLHLRTASRILLRMGDFYAATFSELRKKAARLPWDAYLRPGQPVACRATCHQSKLYHSDGVAERVAGAIGDRLGRQVTLKKLDDTAGSGAVPLVIVRLVHDHCTLSLDTTGALLHRRGYRLETAKAPLRETLAAGLILASGWDGTAPLVDPFCGSGTLPIEAALIARRIAPGKNRRFAFMDWPDFDPAVWQAQLDQAIAAERPAPGLILGSDRDQGAIRISMANAERAGVADSIQFTCRAVSAIEPPADKGWVVTNPPYGVRVSEGRDLRNLYAQLGNVLRACCQGWRANVLCSSDYLIGHAHLRLVPTLSVLNGGIPVRLYAGIIG